eukprot:605122-Prorocentrum_minimum.AAC.1
MWQYFLPYPPRGPSVIIITCFTGARMSIVSSTYEVFVESSSASSNSYIPSDAITSLNVFYKGFKVVEPTQA